MTITVDEATLPTAGAIHSESWQESHRAFCTPEFTALHTPQRQTEYLRQKIESGGRVYMLIEDKPVGTVSVSGSLIEDLYVLPEMQNMGYGSKLLKYAMERCEGTPVLWILENNKGAERLYRRMGFRKTGRRNRITDGLDEVEMRLTENKK